MAEPYVRATRYIVSLLPDSIGFYAQLFEITVERRGRDDRWAVVRHDQYLSSDGVWDDAPPVSEREDGWLDAHRFDFDTAFRLAKEAAPHVTVKGRTAAEVLARLLATGRIAPSTLRRMADEAQPGTEAQQGGVVLSAPERTMLIYALDQAQEHIWSRDGFTDEDQAAVDSLRRLTAEARQDGAAS